MDSHLCQPHLNLTHAVQQATHRFYARQMSVCEFWYFHSSEVEDFILPGWHYIKTTEPLNGYACEPESDHFMCKQFCMWHLLVQRTPLCSVRQFWKWHPPVQRMPLCSIAPTVFFLCALLPQLYCKLEPGSGNTGPVLHSCVFAHALVWSAGTALPVIHTVLLSQDIPHTFPAVPIICILYTGCPEHLQQNTLQDSNHLELYTVLIST